MPEKIIKKWNISRTLSQETGDAAGNIGNYDFWTCLFPFLQLAKPKPMLILR